MGLKSLSYAGIGARKTPVEIQEIMTAGASQLEREQGMILRSGAAHGADSAFERGVSDPAMKEIFLPWKFFNNHPSTEYEPSEKAYEIAAYFHPSWENLSPGVQRLMARNSHQILGKDLDDPVLFVLCWTPEGKGGGGTGQAIRIANYCAIPVFDFGGMSVEEIGKGISESLNLRKHLWNSYQNSKSMS